MRRLLTAALLVCGTAQSALAADWAVDPAKSEIAFSGTHAGKAFRGTFRTWSATIAFDPEKPEAAKVSVAVDLLSAQTGDTTYDRMLPQRDWLDASSLAKAEFVAASVKPGDGPGRYVADGTLAMRGASIPVSLPFTLTLNGAQAEMSGRATLQRLSFAIGRSSDAAGSWVSLEIPVDVKVVATRR
jgi:polyisoprenoid-binding protein YceI